MAVTAGMVKELREVTGAGMMDCKKALGETNGDIDAAIEYLRKNGQATAEKKAGRIAAEGLCSVLVEDDENAVVVEVNSETDFVAKNEKFQEFVGLVSKQALASKSANIDDFLLENWLEDSSKTVKDILVEQISFIGENLSIRRFEKVEAKNGCVVSYLHGGGRIGVLIEAETIVVNDRVKEALMNLAMQVAALSPKYVSQDEVSEEYKNHEKEILLAQAKLENPEKPDSIIEKMIIGRLNKELKEVCLCEQVYVKAEDGKQTVDAYLKQISKEVGSDIVVKCFVRFETGEGIEKKEENFAAEVAKQMGK